MEISVIVPCFNSKEFLPDLLKSLQNQDFRGRYEIVIVDDGSTDGTGELFDKPAKNLLYMRQKNSGPAAARNAGLKKAKGRLIAFVDSDCLPDKSWLSELKKSIGSGAVAAEGKTVTEGKIYPDSHFIRNHKGGMFVTSNIAFLRSAIGEFDRRYPYPNREDSDMAFGLLNKGKNIVFAEKALVRHRLLRSSLKGMLKRKLFFESDVLLFKKYPELYKRHIRYPFDRFALFYILLSLAGFIIPAVWIGLPVLALLEIAYRKYAFGVRSYVKFLVAQTLGSFLNLFAVLKGCVKFGVSPLRLL